MTDHAFLAVALSNRERHTLSATLTEASPGPPLPGRRTPPEKWHITLRFLGECTESEAERVMHSLSQASGLESGRVWCDGLEAFPRMSNANVVYLRVDDPTGLLDYLAAVCDEAAMSAGFEPEGRPYVPHVTLSRLRPARDVRSLIGGFNEFRTPVAVRAITLMRSRDSRYEVVDAIALA